MLEKHIVVHIYICAYLGFPCGLVVTLCRRRKRFRFNLGLGGSPGGGHGNPLQCSCLETPVDRGAWWATVHGITKSWT